MFDRAGRTERRVEEALERDDHDLVLTGTAFADELRGGDHGVFAEELVQMKVVEGKHDAAASRWLGQSVVCVGSALGTRFVGGTDRTVISGEGGAFRVSNLDSGSYTVIGSLHGFHPASLEVDVHEGETTRVRLSLSTATFHDTMQVDAPMPHTTMEATELRESAARDVGEALSRMGGVWKVRKGGIANDVSIRGFRQDDITVLIDGARVAGACPNRMDPPAFHLDFAEVGAAIRELSDAGTPVTAVRPEGPEAAVFKDIAGL